MAEKDLAWSERAPHWGVLTNPLNREAPFSDSDTGLN